MSIIFELFCDKQLVHSKGLGIPTRRFECFLVLKLISWRSRWTHLCERLFQMWEVISLCPRGAEMWWEKRLRWWRRRRWLSYVTRPL